MTNTANNKIHLVNDGAGPDDGRENCCFCNAPTNLWVTEKDVACCQSCADAHTADQVPEKIQWFDENVWNHIKTHPFNNHFKDYKFANGMTYGEMAEKGITLEPYPMAPPRP